MGEYKKTKYNIFQDGEVVVKECYIVYQSDKVALLELCLKSKYCEISGTFSDDSVPGICLSASEQSLYLNQDLLEHDTIITFPEFNRFNEFSCSCSRYSVFITLLKRF